MAPYQRPPLSKAYLAGETGRQALTLRPPDFFTGRDITLRSGVRAVGIDRAGGVVTLDTGERLPYRHLVLATGSRPRRLPVPGADLAGVCTLRTVADADALRSGMAAPARLVIIGGGLIGMEAAAIAAGAGHRVTVIEQHPRPMTRVVSAEVAAHLERLHRGHGTTILTGCAVAALHGGAGRVSAVELTDGTRKPADAVLVCIGAEPNSELAEAAGLTVDNGVVVDAGLRTSDPAISALGDCANFPSRDGAGRVRLESVQNAVDQARHIAAQLTGGAAAPYRAVPWFWTHQFQARVQMAGLPDMADESLTHGDPASGKFAVYRFRHGRLSSVESVNRPAAQMAARALFAVECRPTPAEVRAADFRLDRIS